MKILNKSLVLAAVLTATLTIVYGDAAFIAADFDDINASLIRDANGTPGDPKDFAYAHISNTIYTEKCLGAILDPHWVLTTAGAQIFQQTQTKLP